MHMPAGQLCSDARYIYMPAQLDTSSDCTTLLMVGRASIEVVAVTVSVTMLRLSHLSNSTTML